MLCDARIVSCTIEERLRSYSYQLITNNKRLNTEANISQRNSIFYKQIMVLLKPKLLSVYLRDDAIAI